MRGLRINGLLEGQLGYPGDEVKVCRKGPHQCKGIQVIFEKVLDCVRI